MVPSRVGRTGWVVVGLACLWLVCSRDEEEAGSPPEQPPLPTDASPVIMAVCRYRFPSRDSIEIEVPALPRCDSAGRYVVEPAATCRAWFRPHQTHGADHFDVGFLALAPLVKAITSGPSFSGDIAMFLDSLAAMDPYIRDSIYGRFVRCSTGVGMHGLWQFDSLGPPILYFFINRDPNMQTAVKAISVDDLGRAVLFFDFDTLTHTLRAMLNRRSYGNAAIAQLIDSVCYAVSISTAYDSIWLVRGRRTGDSATVSIDSAGNLHYEYLGVRLNPRDPYTYYLRPLASQCPDTLKAPWWEPFIIPNRTCP